MPDGFEIEFTKPVDEKYANDIASYSVSSFTYNYHAVYGSPEVNSLKHKIKGVKVSADGMRVRIVVENLRQSYIHIITLDGIRDKENAYSLIHPTAYYTLNNIPDGKKLALSELSTINTARSKPGATATGATLTYSAVKPLLTRYTCISCHDPAKKQVGPSFSEIAKRKYSTEKILQLIYNPQPKNWPGYAVSMPPMTQVPRAEARKIVAWIKSLEK